MRIHLDTVRLLAYAGDEQAVLILQQWQRVIREKFANARVESERGKLVLVATPWRV